jgi:hypothetical protein
MTHRASRIPQYALRYSFSKDGFTFPVMIYQLPLESAWEQALKR